MRAATPGGRLLKALAFVGSVTLLAGTGRAQADDPPVFDDPRPLTLTPRAPHESPRGTRRTGGSRITATADRGRKVAIASLSGQAHTFIPRSGGSADLSQALQASGYIVQLSTRPLVEQYASLLSPAGTDSDATLPASALNRTRKAEAATIVGALRNTIEAEHASAEARIKAVNGAARIKKRFARAFNGLLVDNISEADALQLRQLGFKVYPNYSVKAVLDTSVPMINAPAVWQTFTDTTGQPVTGRGVRIGIIDTGVDYRHADLGNCTQVEFANRTCATTKVHYGSYDFVNDDLDPLDDNGHGTHVAATAAGNGMLKGVAPDAIVYAYKVLDNYGSGYTSEILEAIDRATDPDGNLDFTDHLDVINLSLGGTGHPDDPTSLAIDNAALIGVVPVVAAGNYGPGGQSVASPGTARRAITVGAADKSGTIAPFSSRGPVIWNAKTLIKPDLVAPGVAICAAKYPGIGYGSPCANWPLDTTHLSLNGTSMAAPHVAGAAALLRQLRPAWTVRQIKFALKNTSLDDPSLLPTIDGTGRIDVLKAAALSAKPVVAELDVLAAKTSGLVAVRALVNTPSFKSLTLQYQPVGSPTAVTFYSTITAPPVGQLTKITDLNVDGIPEGETIVTLTVEDNNGQIGRDYGYLLMDKLEFTFPLNNDIYRRGATLALKVRRDSSLRSSPTVYSYRRKDAGQPWQTFTGSSWNTTGLPRGSYELMASVYDSNGGLAREDALEVYLDDALKSGWPKRVPYDTATDPFSGEKVIYWGGPLAPVVSDLDGDGSKEVVLFRAGNPPTLMVYSWNGVLKWEVRLGQKEVLGGNITAPLVYDFDNDGTKEIAVAFSQDVAAGAPCEVYVLSPTGVPHPGMPFPVSIPVASDQYALAAADIDGDGAVEIIVVPNAGMNRVLTVLGPAGQIKKSIPLGDLYVQVNPMSYPAVGNLDADPQLEIVVGSPATGSTTLSNEGELHVFNLDGSEVSGFPLVLAGSPLGSSPTIGDINGDGGNDIAVALARFILDPNAGGVYVFDRAGAVLPGWPVMTGSSVHGAPALADLDADGKLEISVNQEATPYVLNHDGGVRKSFAASLPTGFGSIWAGIGTRSAVTLLAAAGSYRPGQAVGGLYAFNPIAGGLFGAFPKATEDFGEAPPVVTDIEGNGKIDIIGSSDWDFDYKKRDIKFRGSVYVWTNNATYLPSRMPWPMFQHDEGRTGCYCQ